MKEELRDDLRSTAESLVDDAERLREIELQKMDLEPEQTETHRLAEKAEKLADDIAHKARAEKRLVEQAIDDAEENDRGAPKPGREEP